MRTSFGAEPSAIRAGVVVLLGQAALGDLRADAGRRVEGGDARATGSELLRQGALRGEDHFELTRQVLAGELLVLTHIGADRAADAAVGEQDAETPVINTAVVADGLQTARALAVQGVDQADGDPAQSESAHREGGALMNVCHGTLHAADHFVDHAPILSCGVVDFQRRGYRPSSRAISMSCTSVVPSPISRILESR
ncbi:hypothetical protein QFZ52_000873 [Arthrobacter woluwensis]|nr:hypothetical protein [Arthrobacter woluwensis]